MLKSLMKLNVKNQPGWNDGHHAIKTTFGVMDEPPLLCCMNPAKLAEAKRKRLADQLAVSLWIWLVSKSAHVLETTNSRAPAPGVLNDPT
jgi:hypothetical protein